MRDLTGLYVEDEEKNVLLMQARFSLFGIKIIGLDQFPQKLDGLYDFIIDNNVDFLIIDHELEKASVQYKGINVLKEIRKNDSNIYAILLTNYPLNSYRGELGEYDFQLEKNELSQDGKMQELAEKIRRACELRHDNDLLASMDKRNDELQNIIQQIKKISEEG